MHLERFAALAPSPSTAPVDGQACAVELRKSGKTVLVLDTVTGSAGDRLYSRMGWQRVGEVPGYALWPDGRPCPTTYFHKQLT